MITSGITQEEIIAWGGPEIFNQALALCNSGDVADAEYDDDALRISGHIRLGGDYLMPVSFDLLADYRIKSNCPCEKNTRYGQICPHVVALGIKIMCDEMAMIENAAANVAPTSQEAQAEDATNYIEVPIKPRFFAILAISKLLFNPVAVWRGTILISMFCNAIIEMCITGLAKIFNLH
jgi:hypothetical protein